MEYEVCPKGYRHYSKDEYHHCPTMSMPGS